MSTLPPSSDDVAKASHLDERYVREWLGGMVVGGIPEYDPHGATYPLATSLSTGGAGLGTVRGEQTACRMHGDAGFTDVAVHSVEGAPINDHDVATTTPT